MKQCKKCGASKAFKDFYRAAGTRDGFRGECKACSAEDKRQRYLADPQAVISRVKR